MLKTLKIMSRSELAILVSIIILPLIKLTHLNTGVLSVEPDEASYLDVMLSLKDSFIPTYFGVPAFYLLPLYFYLSLFTDLFVNNGLLSLRLTSLLFSIGIAVVIFFYMRWRTSTISGAFASLLYSFSPLTVFYSRLGLIEITLSFFMFLFVVLYEVAIWRNKLSLYIGSGLVLAGAVLTKFTSLALFFLPVSVIVYQLFSYFNIERKFDIREILTRTYKHILVTTVPLALLVLLLAFYYTVEPQYLKEQLRYTLLLGGKKAFLEEILLDSKKYVYFLGWPTLVLSIYGVLGLVKNLRKNILFILSFSLLAYFMITSVLSINTVRYSAFLLPWIACLAGWGFFYLSEIITRYKKLSLTLVIVIAILLTAPLSLKAFRGTQHSGIAQVGKYLKEDYKSSWVFSNYWPTTFVVYTNNYKTTWLTRNKYDAAAFSNRKGSKFAPIQESASSFLNKNGGVVVIRTSDFHSVSENHGRESLTQAVMARAELMAEFHDAGDFFPYSGSGEKYSIYTIKPGKLGDMNDIE